MKTFLLQEEEEEEEEEHLAVSNSGVGIMKYGLFFSMELRSSSALLLGKLDLIQLEEFRVLDRYIATSGTVGNQAQGSQAAKGRGVIPRQDQVSLSNYKIDTTPINLPGVKGVEGTFYRITPYMVKFKSGIERGDFGIHFDANVPGSAGCIVIRNRPAYKEFEVQMAKIAAEGVKQIPLLIEYAY
jgi:hypothetical protein